MSLRVVSLSLAAVLWATAVAAQCVEPSFEAFEAAGYRIRRIQVTGLLVGRGALEDLVVSATPLKPGAAFTAAGITRGQALIREALRNTRSLVESPVNVTAVTRTVADCDLQARQLDVVYRIFSTKLRVTGLGTVEPRRGVVDAAAAGQSNVPASARLRVSPVLRYNAAEELVAGARVSWVLPGVFDVFEADVQASKSSVYADIRFSGERVADSGFLRAVNWRLAYSHADRPAERETLKTRALVAHTAATTRPLGASGAVIRFASSLEGGEQRSTSTTAGLPASYLSRAGFATWKSALNLDLGAEHQALNASYGLLLGFTAGTGAVDYSKHVADIAYDARVVSTRGWWSHRPFDVISRFSAGVLRGDSGVPVSERFFGGNVDAPFFTAPGWTLRGSPVLRSYPAYRFNASEAVGRGGDRFLSLNLTTGIPLWFRPLVPAEVAEDAEIRQLIDGQLDSAESTLEVVHRSADPAHRQIAARMPALKATLQAMQTRVATLLPALPGDAKGAANDCDEQIDTLLATIETARYLAFLADASDDDEVTLPSVLRVCVQQLNGQLADPQLEQRGGELAATLQFVTQQIARLDLARARAQARKDMRFPRRAVRAVFEELNAVSIGPVFMLDASQQADRAEARVATTRVGLGAGVRVSVVNALHLNAGYMWNVSRATSAERVGAGFAALEFTTLFGR